jgi:hypothetical protein
MPIRKKAPAKKAAPKKAAPLGPKAKLMKLQVTTLRNKAKKLGVSDVTKRTKENLFNLLSWVKLVKSAERQLVKRLQLKNARWLVLLHLVRELQLKPRIRQAVVIFHAISRALQKLQENAKALLVVFIMSAERIAAISLDHF